jgi:16S rRNA (cytosine967-C5)-methyltransferase
LADESRLIAHRALLAVHADDAYANLVLPRLLATANLSARDAALATELTYGSLRALGTVDEILRRCSKRELAQLDAGVLTTLRIGAYQLLRTRIPPHAAVATAVDLARATGNGRAAGFVNAVLRSVGTRDYESWCALIGADASELGSLALRHSHPGWIVAMFAERLGGDLAEIEAALAADDERPITHLAALPGRLTRAELLAESGGEPGPYSPYAVRMTHGGDPGSLPAVADRRATVQDEGSQLCALALTALPVDGPDRRWLDMCAGPGGKAALLAAVAAGHGAQITANELHPHRAHLVAGAVAGWPVDVLTGDARELPRTGRYDRVLLDAPCTGLGALRRRPEARWRKSPSDLPGLYQLQTQLLEAALGLVRPGGVVGYVTCSPHPQETVEVVEAVLAKREDSELIDARSAFPGVSDQPSETVQLWPQRHGTDAMFFAALRRR